MVKDKREIQDRQSHYKYALKTLETSEEINSYNKEIIKKFLQRGQDNDLSISRTIKVLMQLTRIAKWIKKPFNEVTEDDIRQFKRSLMNNEFQKEDRRIVHKENRDKKKVIDHLKVVGYSNYSDSYKWDFLKILKKFYKDMYGDGEYPKQVKWIKIKTEVQEIPALTEDEVNKLVSYSNQVRYKALIKFLFDSGCRIEEALNVKLSDISVQDGDDPKIDAKPYNSELTKDDYFMVRVRISKTKARTIAIPLCTKELKEWIDKHPFKNNPDSYLFIDRLKKPMRYSAVRPYLNRLGLKVLGKKTTPHMFRHSSATYYASKLNYFPFCKRYGWSLTSKQPARYIDKAGLETKETAKIIKDNSVSQLKRENDNLRSDVEIMKHQLKKMQEMIAENVFEKTIKRKSKEEVSK